MASRSVPIVAVLVVSCGGRILQTDAPAPAVDASPILAPCTQLSEAPAPVHPCFGGTTPDLFRDPTGSILRWEIPPTCLPTRMDPSLAERRDDVRKALDAWSRLPCSRLCLADPLILTPQMSVENCGRGGIGFHPVSGPTEPSNGLVAASAFPASEANLTLVVGGEIIAADAPMLPTDGQATLTALVGRALGLQGSALVDSAGNPSPDAVATYCELYGAQPLCQY